MAKYSFLMDIVHEIIGTVTDRGLEDSEIIKKSNEDEYSMYSENEVKELLTPLKKINSPCDMLTNEEDRQATTNDKNNDGSDDGSNSSQNDCVYGGGNNISYCTKRINQSQFNNDGKIEKQNSFNQSQNFSNMINNNVNIPFQQNLINARINGYNQLMNRRGIPNSYGMFGQQSKTQQPVSTTYSEGIVSHYSKIIDELKEEIKSVKDVFECTIKQKDYYTKSIVDELKKIIEEQNFVISKFRKIIEVSKLLKSSSIKDEQNGIQSNTEGFTIASKREAKLKQKIEEDEEIQQAPFQNNSHQSLNKSQPNFRLANTNKYRPFRAPTKEKQAMSSATLNQEVSLPKNDIDSNDESISLTLTGCNKDKQESKCEPIRSNNEFIGLSKDSCNFDSLGFKTGMNENGISIKNKANLSRFNAFMSKLEDDLDDTAISKKFQIDDDEI